MTISYKTVLKNEEQFDCTPSYLFDYADLYRTNPKDAGLVWLNEAHYGLGVSYGLHSLIGQGHDALVKKKVTLESYTRLKNKFYAEHFDAIDLVQFTVANGMRYIEFNARGEDGFCLFNTKTTDFNCAESPAHRDLLAELSSVCEYEGVGLCLTYSLGRHLTHPHGPDSMKPAEVISCDEYFNFTTNQLHELLTQYGPVAALCLEGVENLRNMSASDFDVQDFYKMLRFMQPQTLISFQDGLSGEEDFFRVHETLPSETNPTGFIHTQKDKPIQLRRSMTPGNLSYAPQNSGQHLNQELVWKALKYAADNQLNLLLNTALLPDGSLDLEDLNTLMAIGERIEHHGFPRH